MNRIGVMQITDSLMVGGMERMAVTVAGHLPPDHFESHLCTTRAEGPLAALVPPRVQRLHLARRGRYDTRALRQLVAYLRAHQVRILHAHGSSLFLAVAASWFKPRPAVVWHAHYGRLAAEERLAWIYRQAARFLSAVIAVNEPLAAWARVRLRVPTGRVRYIPNCVGEPVPAGPVPELPGTPGSRVVCVANLRREKDQLNLVRAMQLVLPQAAAAHLLLLGESRDPDYAREVQQEIAARGLSDHVSFLGCRTDVPAVLRGCDVGVMSSASEGLPLALIEYGMAGLPAVATRVGQCEEVLDEGRTGWLVPPASPDALAGAIIALLGSPEQRLAFGKAFRARVAQLYSPEAVIQRICEVYAQALGKKSEIRNPKSETNPNDQRGE